MCACKCTRVNVTSLGVIVSVQIWMQMNVSVSASQTGVADAGRKHQSCVCERRQANAEWSEGTVSTTEGGCEISIGREKNRWGSKASVSVRASYAKVHASCERWRRGTHVAQMKQQDGIASTTEGGWRLDVDEERDWVVDEWGVLMVRLICFNTQGAKSMHCLFGWGLW